MPKNNIYFNNVFIVNNNLQLKIINNKSNVDFLIWKRIYFKFK